MSRLDPTHERLVQAIEELSRTQLELDRERLARIEGEVRFGATLSSMSDALLITDPKGEVSLANDAAATLTGRSLEELIGSPIDHYFPPEVPLNAADLLQDSPSGRTNVETTVTTGAGPVPVSLSIGAIHDPSGKLLGTVYAARDLSETQRLARELDKERDRWRLLARVNDYLVKSVDHLENLSGVCEEMAAQTSLSVMIFVVRDGTMVKIVSDRRGAELLPEVIEESRKVPAGSTLLRSLQARGTIHSATLKPGFPLFGPQGNIGNFRSAAVIPLTTPGSATGVLVLLGEDPGSVDDEQVMLGEEVAARIATSIAHSDLRESISHLEAMQEAGRVREQMVASISHDMKTPLTVLLGSLEILHAAPDAPSKMRMATYGAMARHAHNLKYLIQQFLDFTRLESGRELTIRQRAFDVTSVIDKVVEDFTTQVPIDTEPAEDLPKVMADPDRVNQILTNLVSNAIKFAGATTPVTIAVMAERDEVKVSVRDRGPGIPPADLANLFQKFFRGEGGEAVEGTGLGLYICKALVEAQGGRISARSRVGKGTDMIFTLPVAEDGTAG